MAPRMEPWGTPHTMEPDDEEEDTTRTCHLILCKEIAGVLASVVEALELHSTDMANYWQCHLIIIVSSHTHTVNPRPKCKLNVSL